MDNIEKSIARYLLKIDAVKLSPKKPYIWASGWKSPVYCDNRKTLSYPQIRNIIKEHFVNKIKNNYAGVESIAGVATAGIPMGVLVAQEMNLPFVYVRSASKKHGLENRVEGVITKSQKVVVIEDLISTGGSSLAAVQALKNIGAEVLGLIAIFSYGFDTAKQNFSSENCDYLTLTNYYSLIQVAVEDGYIANTMIETLHKWREDPSRWNGL